MEQAANVGDTRKLYQLIRMQSQSSTAVSEINKDITGTVITDFESRKIRWMEHFEWLLNHDAPPTPNILPDPPTTVNLPVYTVNCDPPSALEITDVINSLKNKKSPGEDGICAEIFKASSPSISNWLEDIFRTVWTTEKIPQDWSDAVILPFSRKVIILFAATIVGSVLSMLQVKSLLYFYSTDFEDSEMNVRDQTKQASDKGEVVQTKFSL